MVSEWNGNRNECSCSYSGRWTYRIFGISFYSKHNGRRQFIAFGQEFVCARTNISTVQLSIVCTAFMDPHYNVKCECINTLPSWMHTNARRNGMQITSILVIGHSTSIYLFVKLFACFCRTARNDVSFQPIDRSFVFTCKMVRKGPSSAELSGSLKKKVRESNEENWTILRSGVKKGALSILGRKSGGQFSRLGSRPIRDIGFSLTTVFNFRKSNIIGCLSNATGAP